MQQDSNVDQQIQLVCINTKHTIDNSGQEGTVEFLPDGGFEKQDEDPHL
jgi:hypothetical protein